jgi:flagellar hook assembly protein FlgD
MHSPILQTLLRRFRGPLIAIIAVVFSAGIAMAAQPAGNAATGLANASTHAGKTVPVQATDESEEPDESAETDTESSDASDHCTVDLTQDASVLAGLNHGSVVCTAAHQDTPDGYDNHGAWVSHWAKMNKGADAAAAGKANKPSH